MNKIFKTRGLFVALVLIFIAVGYQTQRASALPASLPYGLTMEDTMATVEQKLGQPKVMFEPQAGWEAGLPDQGGSPDHLRYWASYERFGVTIVYNTPSASDKSATIYEVILDE